MQHVFWQLLLFCRRIILFLGEFTLELFMGFQVSGCSMCDAAGLLFIRFELIVCNVQAIQLKIVCAHGAVAAVY